MQKISTLISTIRCCSIPCVMKICKKKKKKKEKKQRKKEKLNQMMKYISEEQADLPY